MKKLAAVTLSLAAVFGLAGCENAQDVARKPEVAENMIEQSVKICPDAKTQGYKQRLNAVLMETATEYLDTVRMNGVTVCLDQRLGNQTLGGWDRTMVSGYYNTGTAKILSLYDTGKMKGESGIFETDAFSYGSRTLRNFALDINDGDVSLSSAFLAGGRYSCGKNCTKTKWREPPDFDADTLAKNPVLRNAPIR